MEEEVVFTEEDVERWRREFNIPNYVNINFEMQKRLYFKSVAKLILGHDPHALMHPQDNELEVWRVLIKSDIIPVISDETPQLNTFCNIKKNGVSVEFRGTVDNILYQLYLLLNYKKENKDDEVVFEKLIMI